MFWPSEQLYKNNSGYISGCEMAEGAIEEYELACKRCKGSLYRTIDKDGNFVFKGTED